MTTVPDDATFTGPTMRVLGNMGEKMLSVRAPMPGHDETREQFGHQHPEDRRDLELAQRLLDQARDPANPEAMRQNLHRRLKEVVDRVNARHGDAIVPRPLVDQIEASIRPMIEP